MSIAKHLANSENKPEVDIKTETLFSKFKQYLNKRNLVFIFLTLVAFKMCYEPLMNLILFSSLSSYYSHITIIPFISGYLIYRKRRILFENPGYFNISGIVLLAPGAVLYFIGIWSKNNLSSNDYASFITFSALIFWIGAFVILYGINAFKKASFPFLFLVFMIPIPDVLMDKIIYALQLGSAWITFILFKLIRIPFYREGFVFHCPGLNIEIAEQCSSIRSSISLLLCSILAGHLFLRTQWRRIIFIIIFIPVTILKNGIRILVLSYVALYIGINSNVLQFFHEFGGILFYIPFMIVMGMILLWLKKFETLEG
jgi:exosortase